MTCCRPNPSCLNFCRLNGELIAGQGVIRNSQNGWEYEVLRVLARGGMSMTYLVYNYQNNKLAVLKEIDAELALKAKAREMFRREARILQSLQHPGIPEYYDFFDTQERYSLVMEMVHGKNLDQITAVGASQALEWLIQTSDILDYLHQRNPPLIHRDIKPANLILRYSNGKITLIDFGAVKEATAPPGTRIVTPGYGSPEQQKGSPCVQSDIYALGTTLIYLLTQQSPIKFYIPTQFKFVGLEAAGVPSALIPAIESLTAFLPEDRPQTAAEASNLLKNTLKLLK